MSYIDDIKILREALVAIHNHNSKNCTSVGPEYCLEVIREAARTALAAVPQPTLDNLRLVQIAADHLGLVALDRDGRVWRHVPGNGWTAIPMNVAEERRGP